MSPQFSAADGRRRAATGARRRSAAGARRLAEKVALVLVAAVLVLLGVPGTALAHDVLISSTPAEGARLPTTPTTVSFTFDQPLQNFEPIVSLVGPDGKQYRLGSAQVDGNVVSSAVTGGPAGAWIAAYRVVSSDGHPVTGEVHFTVTSGTGGSSASSANGGGPADSATSAMGSQPTGKPGAATAPAAGGLSGWLWVGLAIAALLLGAAVFVLVRGPRGRPAGPSNGPPPPGDPSPQI